MAAAPPDPERPPRRRARLASALLSLLAGFGVVVGAWFALRRRAPQLPVFVEEARPAPTPTPSPRPQPAAPAPVGAPAPSVVEPPDVVDPSPAVEPRDAVDSSPAVEPSAVESPAAAADPAHGSDLLPVSGIGRRSAEALAAGGITTLRQLAEADDARLVAALEAAGLRRSPTLSSWPTQARRLLDG